MGCTGSTSVKDKNGKSLAGKGVKGAAKIAGKGLEAGIGEVPGVEDAGGEILGEAANAAVKTTAEIAVDKMEKESD